jgi:FG-GAP-like repeat
MSKKKSEKAGQASELTALNSSIAVESKKTDKNGWLTKLKNHWWAVAFVGLLSLGAMGAGLKYLEESAKREKLANGNRLTATKEQSLLSKINPFIEPPLPSATPQLSKEYIYAGSRMLAVEDANASAAPPADLAVWRPSTGFWYVLGGSTGSQQTAFQWGGTTGTTPDVPVPGDYDGDGKTDFSVFRPSNGTWYVTRSSDGSNFAYAFGQTGDRMAQADYDGDGKTDAAVYRDGWWYIQRSSEGFTSFNFGLASDKPAAADYDGDGKADLAVWRPGDATFYTLKSSTNFTTNETASFPNTSQQPVSGDYDGDGKADYAIRYNDTWIIRNSSTGTIPTPVSWQSGGDRAVQNDYDGDGKVDIAVWKNASGNNWYIRQSSRLGQANELRQEAWGQQDDIPVPAFYRR